MNAGGAWVACGAVRLPVPRADAFEAPPLLSPAPDAAAALDEAMARPHGAPRLHEIARGARSVAIAIPDGSRACPTATILPPVLHELRSAGIGDDRIRVVVGCGLHAPTSAAQRARLAGDEAARRVEILDAQALESPFVALGRTSRGAPVEVALPVAQADLVLTVGIVEPHLYAGFSGGVKGVAIGCAGPATIAWTHRPAFISLPGVALGALRGNSFQETMGEVAARTSLRWAVNAVVDEAGRPAAFAAGEASAAQAALADRHAAVWLRAVAERFDVLVAGVPAPKSAGLYQASRAATYAGLASRPALREGGLIILCADCPEGAGAGPAERNFLTTLAEASDPIELVARGLREPLGPGGQRAFVVARVLQRFRLALVGAPSRLADQLEHLGVAAFDSVDAAVAAAERRLARRARVLAVADALTTVVGQVSPGEAAGQNRTTMRPEEG